MRDTENELAPSLWLAPEDRAFLAAGKRRNQQRKEINKMAHQKPSKKADVDTSVASIFARNVPRSIEEVFPIVGVLRKDYTGEHLKSDVIAGLTVAVMVRSPICGYYVRRASLT